LLKLFFYKEKAFLNFFLPIITQNDYTNIVGFEIQGHSSNSFAELNHFSGLDLSQSKNSGNTITNGYHSTELFDIVLKERGFKHFGKKIVIYSEILALKKLRKKKNLLIEKF